jgi:hypothetical protein
MRKMRREHPDEDGHREDPDHRDGVGQIHEFRSVGSETLERALSSGPTVIMHQQGRRLDRAELLSRLAPLTSPTPYPHLASVTAVPIRTTFPAD